MFDVNNQFIKLRLEKMAKIREMGINPYPTTCSRTHKIGDLLHNRESFIESNQHVSITGRLVAMRRQGKIGFGNLLDISGKIQIFVKQDELGEQNYELFKLCDPGDFIQVEGTCIITQTGEYSVKASQITMLSKNIRPLPAVKERIDDGKTVRYDEFSDIELRFRKRYLDLLLNPDNRQVFEKRAKVISTIRNFLDQQGFLEVETPILQPLYGGANARPFITHHNTLDMDLYLRIATELYLKRLIVGGYERVYEIGKNFRNEGMDRSHNPEFTLLELYQAYSDLKGMMDITENMVYECAKALLDTDQVSYQGQIISVAKPWKRASMLELVKEQTGFDGSDFDIAKITAFCKEKKIEIPKNAGAGRLIAEIFDIFVQETLIQPTLVYDYPKEISPLAKSKPGQEQLVERFELFINGNEFANAFTELNDPLDQRERMEKQAQLRAMGDLEATEVDEDFLEALEYGMPPMGGMGIGIDRLVMLLTDNTSIKEVIFFPQMKRT
jgi:lysyl-tRNA synthetase, class II